MTAALDKVQRLAHLAMCQAWPTLVAAVLASQETPQATRLALVAKLAVVTAAAMLTAYGVPRKMVLITRAVEAVEAM